MHVTEMIEKLHQIDFRGLHNSSLQHGCVVCNAKTAGTSLIISIRGGANFENSTSNLTYNLANWPYQAVLSNTNPRSSLIHFACI